MPKYNLISQNCLSELVTDDLGWCSMLFEIINSRDCMCGEKQLDVVYDLINWFFKYFESNVFVSMIFTKINSAFYIFLISSCSIPTTKKLN